MAEFNTTDFQKIINRVYGEDLDIRINIEGNEIMLESAPENLALIIGRSGRNINSLREIVKLFNKLHNTAYSLRIVE